MGSAGCPEEPFPEGALPDRPLWEKARALRARYWGKDVFLRGIVEFSNYCRQNCLYCGLRRDNLTLPRYRLDAESIYAAARNIASLGFGTIVLQSGEDPAYPAQELAALITRIKERLHLAVTLSLGEREQADYALWRKAGADRYLLKLESVDAAVYARLRPGKQLSDRWQTLHALRELGYETGSGFIAGLPETSESSLEQGLEQLAVFAPDMLSISPFTPHPDTPLGACAPYSAAKTLRAMSLARLALPKAHIPVTSALGLYGDAVRLKALEVGNVLMPSLTPESVREAYAIYPGKNEQTCGASARAAAMRDLVLRAGFRIPDGPGGAWRAPDLNHE